MGSVREKIFDDECYCNQFPSPDYGIIHSEYPSGPEWKLLRKLIKGEKLTPQQTVQAHKQKEAWERFVADNKFAHENYERREREIMEEFRCDVESEYGMTDHPKREGLYLFVAEIEGKFPSLDFVDMYERLVGLMTPVEKEGYGNG